MLGIMLNADVLANSASQQVTVTVVSGFLNVYSPTERNYQENNILVSLNVTTPLEINSIWMIEGRENKYLCSKCKTYNNKNYFSDGKHDIRIQSRFVSGEIIEKNISFYVDSSSPIYLRTSSGLKKAAAKDIVDYLFHYNFTLELKNELAPEDSCSVRAKNGNATLNGINFGKNNKINFYAIQSIEQGQIELSMQNGRKALGYKFKVNETIENSDALLRLSIVDTKTKKAGSLEFDKINKKVDISGNNFSIQGMNAYFISGCSARKTSFWLLEKSNGRINSGIDEIRQILTENPIFISRFENLKFLFTSNWRLKQVLGLY